MKCLNEQGGIYLVNDKLLKEHEQCALHQLRQKMMILFSKIKNLVMRVVIVFVLGM